jgi:hypothetical protein
MDRRPRYHLIELHRPRSGWADLESLACEARAVADALRAEGEQLRFVRTISVPEHETCFHLFEGTDDAMGEARDRSPSAYRRTVASWGGVA